MASFCDLRLLTNFLSIYEIKLKNQFEYKKLIKIGLVFLVIVPTIRKMGKNFVFGCFSFFFFCFHAKSAEKFM